MLNDQFLISNSAYIHPVHKRPIRLKYGIHVLFFFANVTELKMLWKKNAPYENGLLAA